MASNFEILKNDWETLASVGELAEKSLYSDPNTTLFKIRQLAELISKLILKEEKLAEPISGTQQDRLKLMEREDLIEKEISQIFHSIRITGNKAIHEGYSSLNDAKTFLKMAFNLSAWFKEVYGSDTTFDSSKVSYVEPKNKDFTNELKKLQEENEILQKKFEELNKPTSREETKEIKRARATNAARKILFDEAETRKLIDEQLRLAGWEADTENLRYSIGIRPEKGRNIAIAEWPTTEKYVDYALFIGLEFIGVVEAKKMSRDVVTVLDEAKTYSEKAQLVEGVKFVNNAPFGKYKVPFMFATNGRPYIEQLKEKSGIHFLDGRKATNHSKALQNWYSPRDIEEMLKSDVDKDNERLKSEPYNYLTSSNGLGLRDYQIKTIKDIETAIVNGKDKVLVAMATGTGKTRTAIGLIYRFLKSKRFNRILFVVDRASLGHQAADSFKEAKMEDLQSFSEIYDVKELKDKIPEDTTKVHIATIQGLVRRILFNPDAEDKPSVRQYDCIIVDEAHRGYILDKDIEEEDITFKDQYDYVSKYKKVLEYFDAVKIGLTATPALHTIEIFGEIVAKYGYRQAVIDGYLVDHEPPYVIATELNTKGIGWQVGEEVSVYNRIKGQIEKEKLKDEVIIEVEGFNKRVITHNFNKTVVKYLVNELDPDGEGKTLIFAATDEHADLLVEMLKAEFENIGWEIDDNAITKITGYIKNQEEAIKRFKNEKYPNIVVTVDLLTTGVDVPSITNLVFVRRVKSRILYEQMIGRATRLCDRINKDYFKIYDAVGLYDALSEYTNMKPVVNNPKVTMKQLIDEMPLIESEERLLNQIEELLAKMQRKKKAIKKMGKEEVFVIKTKGQTLEEYIEAIKKMPLKEATEKLINDAELFEYLDTIKYISEKQYISDHQDKIIEIKREYGKDNKKPGDYIEEFRKFVNQNKDKINGLKILCQSPEKLSRIELKELKIILEENGYSETSLNAALKDVKHSDIMADIITLVRNAALDEPLVSHDERIEAAVEKIKNLKKWNTIQMKFITAIENQLLKENILTKDDFDRVTAFKDKGGFKKINEKVFNGELENIIKLLNQALYSAA
ncbi:MAG: type I restriction-modification system endonuclease [Spirochaetes bacterium GWD1_27_9]|nr:MAG: type I restriction-modification system endonuclease [Spirochaetes bacterium GWB1_27_13]OHD27717.1 MAG: type I restriction-modification system endonuclease [Spirochaetes bacterium GWC1_27_15]OHD43678.1 MAG: type I restriction-modification system endonuclease [Spirochaetes bacterium GWD1_27_9]